MSVVLPCGYGEAFAPHTVRSIFLATPPDVLHEIIVVDDAADPPIAPTIPDAQAQKVRVLRHDEPVGLIAAKQAGADAATGDILLFLDCHVKPASNYWKPMVDEIRENYRRVVVPTITKLDVDTWTEFDRPRPGQAGTMSKCYLTFDAEFKWTTDHTRYVPIMSGGLLAISRRWWRETGGYDGRMAAWGGENIDQSLRIWLCGGEIVSAPASFVAHMWRDPSKPKTVAKYRIPPGTSELNRARAAKAHMGRWFARKVQTFPAFRGQAWRAEDLDITNIQNAMQRGHGRCRAFDWYLGKFSYIYRDAGLVPRTIFQLRLLQRPGARVGANMDERAALCLAVLNRPWGNAESPAFGELGLVPCAPAADDWDSTHAFSKHALWWHRANRDPAQGDKCCSGLRSWNTDQCIDTGSRGRRPIGSTFVCALDGKDPRQHITFDKVLGRLVLGHSGNCLSVPREQGDSISRSLIQSVVAQPCATSARWEQVASKTPVEFSLLNPLQRKVWPE